MDNFPQVQFNCHFALPFTAAHSPVNVLNFACQPLSSQLSPEKKECFALWKPEGLDKEAHFASIPLPPPPVSPSFVRKRSAGLLSSHCPCVGEDEVSVSQNANETVIMTPLAYCYMCRRMAFTNVYACSHTGGCSHIAAMQGKTCYIDYAQGQLNKLKTQYLTYCYDAADELQS